MKPADLKLYVKEHSLPLTAQLKGARPDTNQFNEAVYYYLYSSSDDPKKARQSALLAVAPLGIDHADLGTGLAVVIPHRQAEESVKGTLGEPHFRMPLFTVEIG